MAKKINNEFPIGSLVQQEGSKQVAEVVQGGLKGFESETDPRFLELGGFKSVQKVTPEQFTTLQGISVPTTDDAALDKAITDKSLKDTDIVTSEETAAEKLLKQRREAIETGAEAQASKIERKFERQIKEVKETGAEKRVSALEALRGVGVASTLAVTDRIDKATQRSVSDLQSRRDDALANNDIASAGRIDKLILNELDRADRLKEFEANKAIAERSVAVQESQEKRLTIAEQNRKKEDDFDFGLKQFDLLNKLGQLADVNDDTLLDLSNTLGVPLDLLRKTASTPDQEVVNSSINATEGFATVLKRNRKTGEFTLQTFDLDSGGELTDDLNLIKSWATMVWNNKNITPISDGIARIEDEKLRNDVVKYIDDNFILIPGDPISVEKQISRARLNGDTDDEIREALKTAGTPQAIIDRFLPVDITTLPLQTRAEAAGKRAGRAVGAIPGKIETGAEAAVGGVTSFFKGVGEALKPEADRILDRIRQIQKKIDNGTVTDKEFQELLDLNNQLRNL